MKKHSLILLPGWGMDATVWEPVEEVLAEYFNLLQLNWQGLKSAAVYPEHISNLIDKKVEGSFSLLGWSLGSLLAIDAAARYKNRVKKLILAGGTSRFTRDRASGYNCGWPQSVIAKMQSALSQERQKTLDSFYYSMFSESEIQRGHYQRFMEKRNNSAGEKLKSAGEKYQTQELLAGLDFLVQADYRNKLDQIEAPVLIVHGEKDTVCPVAASAYISSSLPGNVSFKVLEGAGHIPFYTEAEAFIAQLKGFVKRGEA